MRLFSTRYKKQDLNQLNEKDKSRRENFLDDRLRQKLQFKIKQIVEKDEYIESFLLIEDQDKLQDNFSLRKQSLESLSISELGYNLTDVFSNIRENEFYDINSPYWADSKLLDLIEILIIFSRNKKRNYIIELINQVFEEEDSDFRIVQNIIIIIKLTTIRNIVPLIANAGLRKLMEEFYQIERVTDNYINLARLSADILQNITSSEKSKKDTKTTSEKLLKEVSKEWTDKTNETSLFKLLNDSVKLAKKYNNSISDIRHSYRSTIRVFNPNFYKMITLNNIGLAELVILTLPSKFILQLKPESIKSSYLKTNSIDKDEIWHYEKKQKSSVELIDPDDLPF